MKRFAVIILWVFLVCLLILLSWGVALVLNWPAWGGLAIFFGAIGVFYGAKLIHRLWVVSRSRAKLAQSEIRIEDEQRSVRDAMKDLSQRWKAGLNMLRRSTLRKYGNPVYALPWYLVVGPHESGKTSAISHANLVSLINNRDVNAPLKPTESIDWWFFNNAVLIDTAGKFVDPEATEAERLEWNQLLDLMSKSRFWESLNGLVVTIDAKLLLKNDTTQIESYARVLRQRIEQLIRLFDARFPVYVMVTQCDHIDGFNRWTLTLDEAEKEQAFGYIGDEGDGEGVEQIFLDRALLCLEDRLRQHRLNLAMKGIDQDSSMLLLVAEIEKLRSGLQTFFASCFGNSAYLEQPFLRGLYLTSAEYAGLTVKQETPSQDFAENSASRGVFLKDLFDKILPHDRHLKRPTVLVNRWRVLTRNIAMIAWVAVIIAASAFVIVSYVQATNAFVKLEVAFPDEQVRTSQQLEDQFVVVLAMKNVVDLLLEQEDDFLPGWLAFGPKIVKLGDDIKKDYVERVRKIRTHQLTIPIYEAALKSNNPSEQADGVIILARQINLIQARLNGATYEKLRTYPQIPTAEAIRLKSYFASAAQDNFGVMYTAYIAWSPTNDDFLRLHMLDKRDLLTEFVVNTHQADWLLDWADTQPEVRGIDLKDFWLPSAEPSPIKVRGAFTQAGADRINALLEEIRLAMNDSMEYQAKRLSFDRWYKAERINAWQSMAWSFTQGELLLKTEPEWRDMLTRINSNSSPYFRFIDRVRSEFASTPADQLPDWLVFIRDFKAYTSAKSSSSATGKVGLFLSAINKVSGQAIRDSLTSGSMLLPDQVQKTVNSIDAYRKYSANLDVAIAGAISSEDSSLKMASAFFGNVADAKAEGASLPSAYNSFAAFKKSSLYNVPDDQIVWNLLAGPLQMLVRYTNEQASCMLQKNWEKSVLWRTQLAISAKELSQQLYGSEGSVWAFVDGPAKPFVAQQANGFTATKVNEFVFPFTPEFVPYLNRSISSRVEQIVREQRADSLKGKTAKLTMASKPISVNSGAKARPYAVLFNLQCTTGEVALNNFNTPATDTIAWSPEICGDVSLQIKIDNLTLTRRYPGPFGLIRFIEEFQDGERKFTPLDFPAVKTKLDALGVKTIGVRYDFSGLDGVLQLAEDLNYLPDAQMPANDRPSLARKQVPVPQNIAQCWKQTNPEAVPLSVSSLIQRQANERLQDQGKPAPSPQIIPPAPKVPQTKAATKPRTHAHKENKATSTKQAPVQDQRYFVQVGVYSSQSNIKTVQKQLTNIGMKMVLEPMNGDLSGSRRLLVGPYATKEAASKALKRLSILGMGGLVVTRTP